MSERVRRIPTALTIAGSDSGGGAGIEADLKTFAALRVHGMVAITSVTAQNTREVRLAHDLPPEVVVAQVRAVAEDLGVDAAKTGMLSNSGIIKAVADVVKEFGFPLVVDPVMVAKSGAPLLRPEAVDTLIKELIPLSTVVTPNVFEAERMTGLKVRSLDDARAAAKYIVEELGAGAAVVKGGHLEGGEAVDVLYYKGKFKEFRAPRIEGGCYHGTGCSFSAAITAELAKGRDVVEAVRVAKEFITTAIKFGLKVGGGHCPVNPSAWVDIPALKWSVRESVSKALKVLLENSYWVVKYVPEVGMNLVEALPYPYAESEQDVAGVDGRVVKSVDSLRPAGEVRFGASRHLARLVLKSMEFDPTVRAALNLRYSEELVVAAAELGLTVAYVGREEEPEEVKKREGGTLPWEISVAYRKLGRVPEVLYDLGDVGKEPMVRFLGRDALDVVLKTVKVVREAAKYSGR